MSQSPNNVQSNENLPSPVDKRMRKFVCPFCQAIRYVKTSDRFSIEEIFALTKIDRWFLVQIKEIVDFEEELAGVKD